MYTAHEEKRKHDQGNDEAGIDDSAAYLDRSLVDDLQGRARGWQTTVFPQPAVDILHINDRIVHHLANGNCQPSQSHSVDGSTPRPQHCHRGEQGEGNGGQADKRRAQVGEEDQQDHNHQGCPQQQGTAHIGQRALNKRRLAKEAAVELYSRGKCRTELVDYLFHPPAHLQGVRPDLLGNNEQDAVFSFNGRVPHLQGRSQVHLCHLS